MEYQRARPENEIAGDLGNRLRIHFFKYCPPVLASQLIVFLEVGAALRVEQIPVEALPHAALLCALAHERGYDVVDDYSALVKRIMPALQAYNVGAKTPACDHAERHAVSMIAVHYANGRAWSPTAHETRYMEGLWAGFCDFRPGL